MRVLLINPPDHRGHSYIREGRCMQKSGSWASMWMPLTLAYIAGMLRDEHEVRVVDLQAEGQDMEDLGRLANTFQPDLLVCNTGFPTIQTDFEAVATVKRECPRCVTSVFGMYPTLIREGALEECLELDIAVVGEPEWSYKALAECLEQNGSPESVAGLVYRALDGSIQHSTAQSFRNNELDTLPYPARDLLNNQHYLYPLDRKPFTLLMLSRGCPYSCTFCNAFRYYGKKFRRRSVDSIIAEIRECIEQHGIRNFLFWGESFSLDFEYAHEITDALLESSLDIKWSTRTMVDRIDPTLLGKMRRAGCQSLSLGIESYNQEVLDSVSKGTSTADIDNAIRAVRDADILAVGHFVIGLPGDTEEKVKATVDFAISSQLDFAQFYCAVPYPKTPLGEMARARGWIESEDLSRYHLSDAVMGNGTLSASDVARQRTRAYRRFYLRPSLILAAVSRLSLDKISTKLNRFSSWTIGGQA